MKLVRLEVVASPGCHNCRAFEEFWQSIAAHWPQVVFVKHDITTPAGQALAAKHSVLASPGIILNDQLFMSGGFDRDTFIKRLQELST